MNAVAQLIERLNNPVSPMQEPTPFTHTDHAEMMAHALHGFYRHEEKEPAKHWLRMSALGKPHVLGMCLKPSIKAEIDALGYGGCGVVTETDAMTLLQGHLFESWFVTTLKRYGWDVLYPTQDGVQLEVNYKGVYGHIDVVARDPEGRTHLIECKSIGSHGSYTFVKDYRSKPSYLTQLALYKQSIADSTWPVINPDTVGWVLWNKQAAWKEAAFSYVQPSVEHMAQALNEVDYLLSAESKVNTLEELLETEWFLPPEAEAEVYQREETGKWRLPMEMSFSPHKHIFYDIVCEKNKRGKMTEYVISERSYQDVLDNAPNKR